MADSEPAALHTAVATDFVEFPSQLNENWLSTPEILTKFAVNAEGKRELVGFDLVTTEDTAAWTEFLRSLVARGLTGTRVVCLDQ